MKRWVVREGDGVTVAAILTKAKEPADAVREGRVFVNRKRVQSANSAVRVGDVVTFGRPQESAGLGSAGPAPRILAVHFGIVAVEKPAGIPTIPDLDGSAHAVTTQVARELGCAPDELHPTSRLDQAVSGVLLLARNAEARAELAEARNRGTYERRYVALAAQAPRPARGVWDAPIGRGASPRVRKVNGADAVAARSEYAVVEAVEGAALLALRPITGRTHQLRVHAASAGAPLLGDREYGGPPRLVLPSGAVRPLSRIALHAAWVEVKLRSGTFRAEAVVPAELTEVWAALGGGADAWNRARTLVVSGS